MSKAITKAERDAAITATANSLTSLIAERRERDSAFAEGARKRSDKYLAFFATAKFATAATDLQIDLNDMFSRCDKTLDRFVRVLDCLLRDTLLVASDRDQNRYTFNLMRTLVASVNQKTAVNKVDVLATATKRDDAQEFVNVSKRVMSDLTADRQSGIAVFTLELLGFLNRTKNSNGSVEYHVNKQSKIYRKVCNLIASGK